MPSVIYHANEKIGKRVGDGECTRIAEYALSQAGMKTTRDFRVTGNDADYVWGTNILADNALPGDILQFRNHVIRVTRRRFDGTLIEPPREYRRGHHTAVLASKNVRYQDEKKINGVLQPVGQYFSFSILEQHCCNKSVVHKSVIQVANTNVSTMDEEIQTDVFGTVQFYRPSKK